MKYLLTASAAALLFATAASHAASIVQAGVSESEVCSRAAAQVDTASQFTSARGIAHCDAALAGALSQNERAATLVNRGVLNVAAGDTHAGMADYDAALARNPRLAAAYLNRGTILLRDTRYQEARADFNQALALNTPNPHVAYFNRASAEEAMGEVTAAYHDYRKAQELAPDFHPARMELTRFQVVPRRTADNR